MQLGLHLLFEHLPDTVGTGTVYHQLIPSGLSQRSWSQACFCTCPIDFMMLSARLYFIYMPTLCFFPMLSPSCCALKFSCVSSELPVQQWLSTLSNFFFIGIDNCVCIVEILYLIGTDPSFFIKSLIMNLYPIRGHFLNCHSEV